MVQADALAAEHSQVVRAVEVLHAVRVLPAQLLLQRRLLLLVACLFKVKVRLRENGVFLDYLVKDVDVQGQSFGALELLHELAADGAAHAVVVVQRLDARSAERVAAVHQDTGNPLAHIVLEPAELADVETPRVVVQVQDLRRCLRRLLGGRGGLTACRHHFLV